MIVQVALIIAFQIKEGIARQEEGRPHISISAGEETDRKSEHLCDSTRQELGYLRKLFKL